MRTLFHSIKQLATVCLLGAAASFAQAQAPAFAQAALLNPPANGAAQNQDVALDAAGNSYVTGSLSGTLVLGTTTLRSQGGADAYVAKYDAAGMLLWAVRAGGSGDDEGRSLAIGANGLVYVAGTFASLSGTSTVATFGSTSLTNTGYGKDIFVAALTSGGTWQWAARAGGTNDDEAVSVAVASTGDAVLTGSYYSPTATFGATALSLTPSSGRLAMPDAYVARISSTGTWQWATKLATANGDVGQSIAVDNAGNAYTALIYGNTPYVAKHDATGGQQWVVQCGNSTTVVASIAADASGTTYLTGRVGAAATQFGTVALAASTTAATGLFVARLSAGGAYDWAVRADGGAATDVALDASGNACLTGIFYDATLAFGSTTLTKSATTNQGFVASLSSAGTWRWVTQAGAPGQALALAGGGAIGLVGGLLSATASFGSLTLTSIGTADAYLGHLSAAGAYQWVRQAGGGGSVQSGKVLTDAVGNMYRSGSFSGVVHFGPAVLTSLGSSDIYVSKLNAAGNYLWTVQAGSTGGDEAPVLAVDNSGNVFVSAEYDSYGSTVGSTTVHFGSITSTTYGGNDILVAKLTSAGQWQWVAQGGGNFVEHTNGLATDASGNIYVAGSSGSNTSTFGSTTFTGTAFTGDEIIVAKLNAAGAWQWAVRAGGNGTDYSTDLQVQGNSVYATGYFYSPSATFGSTTLANQGFPAGWVAKLDLAGNWQWVTGAGTQQGSYVVPCRLAVDGTGNVYLAGGFASLRATFGLVTLQNANPSTSINNYSADLFVAKLNPAGTWQWATQGGGPGDEYCQDLALDASGNAYLAGWFYKAATCVIGTTTLTNANATTADLLVARMNAGGTWQWAASAGGTGDETAATITVVGTDIYLTGSTDSPAFTVGTTSLLGSPGRPNAFGAVLGGAVALATQPGQATADIEVWPNPTTNSINLRGLSTGQRLEILDALGRVLTTTSLPANGTLHLTLPTGLYLLRAAGQTRKLVVQ